MSLPIFALVVLVGLAVLGLVFLLKLLGAPIPFPDRVAAIIDCRSDQEYAAYYQLLNHHGFRLLRDDVTRHVRRSIFLKWGMLILDNLSENARNQLGECKSGIVIVCKNPAEAAEDALGQFGVPWNPKAINNPDPEFKDGYLSLVLIPELGRFIVFRVHALKMMFGHK